MGDAKLTGGGLLAMLGAVAVAYLQGPESDVSAR